jgi:hypothetical protein
MSIAELGSLGEFLSSIVVLITIIYLAMQVRQNTTAMKSSQSSQFVSWNTGMVEPLALDREVMELWLKGDTEFYDLDETDKQRMIFFEWRAISAWNHHYHMRMKGLVDDHLWSELLWIFENIGQRTTMKEAWKVWRGAYSEEFQSFMDQYLGKPHEEST